MRSFVQFYTYIFFLLETGTLTSNQCLYLIHTSYILLTYCFNEFVTSNRVNREPPFKQSLQLLNKILNYIRQRNYSTQRIVYCLDIII